MLAPEPLLPWRRYSSSSAPGPCSLRILVSWLAAASKPLNDLAACSAAISRDVLVVPEIL